jgi:hypothetical protein
MARRSAPTEREPSRMEGPLSPFDGIEDSTWQAGDELSGFDARRRRPGWLWLGYIALGIAIWTGVAFGIRALITAL